MVSVDFLEDLMFRTGGKADDSRILQVSCATRIM